MTLYSHSPATAREKSQELGKESQQTFQSSTFDYGQWKKTIEDIFNEEKKQRMTKPYDPYNSEVVKIRSYIRDAVNASALFITDPTAMVLAGGKEIEHWNLTLLVDTFLRQKNMICLGEPGFGKTTAVNAVGSVLTGLPYEFFESTQIRGHPQQTVEEMLARPDFSKLTTEEKVIWQAICYSEFGLIDEFSRMPEGKRSILLEVIRTGRVNYLNDTIFIGHKPWYITWNPGDQGSDDIRGAMADRFHVAAEFGYLGSAYKEDIKESVSRQKHISNIEKTNAFFRAIKTGKLVTTETGVELDEFRMHPKFPEEYRLKYNEYIASIPYEKESTLWFLNTLVDELNYAGAYGRKRIGDPVDPSTHSKNLASQKVMNATSPRAYIESLETYARALAFMSGHHEVTIEHVRAVAPYTLGHRLVFNEDFKSKHVNLSRRNPFEHDSVKMWGEPESMSLVRALVDGVETNYKDTTLPGLSIANFANKVIANPKKELSTHEGRENLQKLLDYMDDMKQSNSQLDHPTLKCVFAYLQTKEEIPLPNGTKIPLRDYLESFKP